MSINRLNQLNNKHFEVQLNKEKRIEKIFTRMECKNLSCVEQHVSILNILLIRNKLSEFARYSKI